MSKETREFDIAVMDYSTASVRVYRRTLPKDIQTDELEEIPTQAFLWIFMGVSAL